MSQEVLSPRSCRILPADLGGSSPQNNMEWKAGFGGMQLKKDFKKLVSPNFLSCGVLYCVGDHSYPEWLILCEKADCSFLELFFMLHFFNS